MNQPNEPMNFNPGPTPTGGNNRTWLIVGIVVLVLCCCCVVGGVLAWQYGDQILKSFQGSGATSILMQTL
jgi:hypothetical protein